MFSTLQHCTISCVLHYVKPGHQPSSSVYCIYVSVSQDTSKINTRLMENLNDMQSTEKEKVAAQNMLNATYRTVRYDLMTSNLYNTRCKLNEELDREYDQLDGVSQEDNPAKYGRLRNRIANLEVDVMDTQKKIDATKAM